MAALVIPSLSQTANKSFLQAMFRCATHSLSHFCRLLQRPASLYAAAGQAGLAAGRADAHAAGAALEQMPMGLRRIAGQAAQILSSHVSPIPKLGL